MVQMIGKLFPSGKKAISPVIATVLMANIMIVMFVIILAGFVPSIGLTQSRANIWFNSQEQSSLERIDIEMIYFNQADPETIDVYVRNVGEIDLEIEAMYVNGTIQNDVSPILPGHPIYVKVGNATWVEKFAITYDWESGITYQIKVVTARGNWDLSEATPD